MPLTLSLYLARQFTMRLLVVILVAIIVVLLFDTLELMRILFIKQTSILTILKMSLYRNFAHIQKILPFIILISTILTYFHLTKTFELIIAKAAGLSIWQLLIPPVIVAFIFGIFYITIITPITSLFISKYEKMEAHYVKDQPSLLVFAKTGLWLKQESNNDQRYIIHALKIIQPEQKLLDVTIYYLDKDNAFIKRIDTDEMLYTGKGWYIADGILIDRTNNSQPLKSFYMPASLTFNQIQESMILPETISFWKLPNYIYMAEKSGFATNHYKLYFYKLLVLPLFFVSMITLGSTFALGIPRYNKKGKYLTFGILAGFVVYFLSDVIFALGASGKLPLLFSATTPTLLILLIGVIMNIYLEEGK